MRFKRGFLIATTLLLTGIGTYSLGGTTQAAKVHHGFPSWTQGKWHSTHYIFKISGTLMWVKHRGAAYNWQRYSRAKYHPWGSTTQDVLIYNHQTFRWKWVNFVHLSGQHIAYAYHPLGAKTTLSRGWNADSK